MNPDILEGLAFFLTPLIVAAICHSKQSSYSVAVSIATVVSVSVFFLAQYAIRGHSGYFPAVELIGVILIYTIISALLGLPFAVARKKERSTRGE